MISLWLYRRMLAFYPVEMRREYGSEMVDQFHHDWAIARHCGRLAAVGFWLHLLRDWVTSVAGSHAGSVQQDLTVAGAGLRRRPASTAALVVFFALVITANTVALLLGDRLLLQPVPFDTQGRLVFVAWPHLSGSTEWQILPWSLAERLRQSSRTLSGVAFFEDFNTEVEGFRCRAFLATPPIFKDLGLQPAIGRLLAEGDIDVAVVSPRLWEERYRLFPRGIGSSLRIRGRDYRIAGVASEQLPFPFDADIWLSLPSTPPGRGLVLARLRPGVSLPQAQTEWMEIRNKEPGHWSAELAGLSTVWRNPLIDVSISASTAAFSVVLLLACADIASFQFGHVFRRQREIAIRMALGASRARLVRFLLTESLVLAFVAGVLSLPLTACLIRALHATWDWWGLRTLIGWSSIRFDGLALAITCGITLASGLISGIFPAWRFAARAPWLALHPAASGVRSPMRRFRLSLLAVQVALAIPLVFLAIVLTVEGNGRLNSPSVRFFDSSWRLALAPHNNSEILEKISHSLREQGHSPILTSFLPFIEDPNPMEYEAGKRRHSAQAILTNERFFKIPGFRWCYGRPWTEEETRRDGPLRIVVSQTLAEETRGLGSTLVLTAGNGRRVSAEIAGIVEPPPLNFYQMNRLPIVFLPWQRGSPNSINLIVEGSREETEAILHSMDPELKPFIQNYRSRILESWTIWRWMIGILWAAGLLALSLAIVGMAAYLTQTFAERDHDVALRFALGSGIREIWLWVTCQLALPFAAGSVVAITLVAGALLATPPMWASPALILWAAAVLAVVVLWVVWSAIAWLASARAASGILFGRLRHI